MTVWGYDYGLDNHIDFLPRIFKALDPGYLPQDLYVQSLQGFGPRFYFTRWTVLWMSLLPLPLLAFLFTWLVNVAQAWLTCEVAREFFPGSERARLWALGLVFGATTFRLGAGASLGAHDYNPYDLGLPLAWLGLLLVLRDRPVPAAVALGLAGMIHPHHLILGLVLMLLRGGARGLAVFGCLALAVVVPSFGLARIEELRFVEIYARLRLPHHLLASRFELLDYLRFGFFAVAVGVAFRWWRRQPRTRPEQARLVRDLAAALVGLCLVGVVLVEVLPTRFGCTLQPFRQLQHLQWLGFILLAGQAAGERPWLYLASLTAPSAGLFQLGGSQRVRILGLALGLVINGLSGYQVKRFLVFGGLAVLLERHRWVAVVAGLALGLRLWGTVTPTLEHHQDPLAAMGREVRRQVDPDGLLLVPPLGGGLRLHGERALVVDFKSFPHNEAWMEEWVRRMEDVYGPFTAGGFDNIPPMEEHYRRLTDDDLVRLRERYGATHAVLFADTPTRFPELASNREYRLVSLSSSRPSSESPPSRP